MKTMQNLKCLGYEFYGYDHVSDDIKVLFPALKTLHVEEATNLIEWMEVATERVTVFPCLEELTLRGCNQLRSAPSHFPSLKKLVIEGMNSGGIPIASILSNKLTTLTSLVIHNVRGLACLPERLLEKNQNLSYMQINDCSELTFIAPAQSQGFEYCCASLQELTICNCPKLRCLPVPLSLEKLEIGNCNSLESIIPIIPDPEHGGLPSLRELEIFNCPQLSSLPDGLQYCTSLQELKITSCPKVTSIPIDSLSTTLRDLTVSNPESLPILHSCFTSLRRLAIKGCQSTQIDLQFCVFLQVEQLVITECPNLESVPSLDKLTSLRELTIYDWSRLTCLPSGIPTRIHPSQEIDTWSVLEGAGFIPCFSGSTTT